LTQTRSAALLLRVWVEGGPDELRGRLAIIDTSDAAMPEEGVTVAVAATPGDVINAVRQWLDGFLDRGVEAD